MKVVFIYICDIIQLPICNGRYQFIIKLLLWNMLLKIFSKGQKMKHQHDINVWLLNESCTCLKKQFEWQNISNLFEYRIILKLDDKQGKNNILLIFFVSCFDILHMIYCSLNFTFFELFCQKDLDYDLNSWKKIKIFSARFCKTKTYLY